MGERLRDLVPGRTEGVGALLDVGPAGVGEPERAPSLGLFRDDQALILELAQRGIHRAGARLPDAAAAVTDLLDQLVTIARFLGEQDQRGCADITATAAPTARAERATGTGAECPETEAGTAGKTGERTTGRPKRPRRPERRPRRSRPSRPSRPSRLASASSSLIPIHGVPVPPAVLAGRHVHGAHVAPPFVHR